VRIGVAGAFIVPGVFGSASSGVVVRRPVLGVDQERRRRRQLHDQEVWRGTVMRQVGDTLVWLALIAVVVAVLYVTPFVASLVSSREKDGSHNGRGAVARHVVLEPVGEPVEDAR
jgi:hypothetical protein